MKYSDMAKRANPNNAAQLALVLLRIYEADRTDNCGVINGEAILCHQFRVEARHVLTEAGILTNDGKQ